MHIYIYINLPANAIVRLPYPRSGDSQGQETVLAPSADKQTCSYDRECSNHHPSLSTLRSKGLGRSKINWWAIYIFYLHINRRVQNFTKFRFSIHQEKPSRLRELKVYKKLKISVSKFFPTHVGSSVLASVSVPIYLCLSIYIFIYRVAIIVWYSLRNNFPSAARVSALQARIYNMYNSCHNLNKLNILKTYLFQLWIKVMKYFKAYLKRKHIGKKT